MRNYMSRVILALLCVQISCVSSYNIGLCIMATGKYISFVMPLITSARVHFCPGHSVTFFVFTDGNLPTAPDIVRIQQPKMGWPYDTMMRFATYLRHADVVGSMDYVFACDADMLFVDTCGDEMLGERVATCHPGYVGNKPVWPDPQSDYDRNPASTACIAPHEGKQYFAGGFYGGSAREFIRMMLVNVGNIMKDLDKGIIARWHDESHLNRYFIDNEPTVILSPSYCYPEHGYTVGYPQHHMRLVALDKNHAELRLDS
jgi:histo-blood group ABO system transferase